MRKILYHGFFGLFFLTILSCSTLSSGSSPTRADQSPQENNPPLPVCEPADSFQGFPIMPGALAGEEEAGGNVYCYTIKETAQKVKEYYLREMPLAGWEFEDINGDSGGEDDVIRMRYRKGDESIATFIDNAGGGLEEVTMFLGRVRSETPSPTRSHPE